MSSNLFNLSGKVALVTGASRGIGESIAKILAQNGAHVIVTSRKIDGCEKVVNEIKQAGYSAQAIACHIGNTEQIDALFSQIKAEHGRLDVLVNNAATNPYFGHILDTDLSAYQKTVQVNIQGYFFMCVQAGKIMKENGGGSIVNVASVHGMVPGAMQGIYSITKASVISMTKAFAKECAQMGIRVNALLPGATDTKFSAALVKDTALLEKTLEHIPMNRVAEPEEMAATVLYLASEASSYTTGACINVDGGFLLV